MNQTETIKASRKAIWTLRLAITSLVFFIVVLTINYFRLALFGVVPGYAPHNFSFNLLFFIPTNFLILIMALIVITRILNNWNNWGSLKERIIPLGLTIPIVGLWIFQIVRILN